MNPHQPFEGVITALITPFHNDGSIDYGSFKKLIEYQRSSKIHGIVILGTTGENPTLNDEESKELILEALMYQTEYFHV